MRVDMWPFSVAVGLGSVWLLNGAAQQLFEIDPATNAVVGAYPVPQGTFLLGVGLGSVWLEGTDDVLRLDPDTGRVQTILGTSPVAIAITSNAVWASDTMTLSSGTLKEIDPKTNGIVASLDVQNRYWVAATDRAVWLAGPTSGAGTEVLRVDPATARPVGSPIIIPLNTSHQGFGYLGPGLPIPWVTIGGGSVWVFRFSDGEIDRITPPGGV